MAPPSPSGNRDMDTMPFCSGEIGYQGIVDHINEGVAIIKDGLIVFANRAFGEICQTPPREIAGTELMAYIAPSERPAVMDFLEERILNSHIPGRMDFTLVRSGEPKIVEMKASVVQCDRSLAILAALTDVTERRQTRLALTRLKDRLESILHSMNDVVVSLSHVDQSILAINPSAEALYGVPLKDFQSGRKHIIDFIHSDDLEKVKAFFGSLCEIEFADMTYRIVSTNGEVKWVLDEGRIVYGEGGRIRRIDHVIRDVTNEKLALDALRASEAKYRSFFESTNDMAYAVTPDGRFLDINAAGMKLLGFATREEALASNIKQSYLDIAERDELMSDLRKFGVVTGKRVRLKLKNGDVVELAITAHAKTDDNGELKHHECIAHNITQALEDQRNRVLRNVAGGLCHYLNSHLASLNFSHQSIRDDLGYLETLLPRLAGTDEAGSIAEPFRSTLASLHESMEWMGDSYDKIARVTKAFNSAFVNYKEEAYLDKTILDIFQSFSDV